MRYPESLALLLSLATAAQAATLTGFAELPADTFVPGPTSGQFIKPANGREPPFQNEQPVQGFSALLNKGDGLYLALSDNGFGRRENSSDYLLCFYRLEPDFRTADGGTGVIEVQEVVNLSDPSRLMPYAIEREGDRRLTGADLDPESFRNAADGSFWVGEEFSPSLLHFSVNGELLARPYVLAGLASEGNPAGLPAILPRSRGFEGMARSPDVNKLYPMLEGPLLNGNPGLNIYVFDIGTGRFESTGADDPAYRYRLDDDATAIGDFTLFTAGRGLVIERDSKQGIEAKVKKVYMVDFGRLDDDGFLHKTLVADLLAIDDPDDLDRDGSNTFTFPFRTIEGLAVVNNTTLAIVNDNNYPFGKSREPYPEHTEMILLEIPPLW